MFAIVCNWVFNDFKPLRIWTLQWYMSLTRWSKVNIQNRCLKNSNFSPIFQPLKTDFQKSFYFFLKPWSIGSLTYLKRFWCLLLVFHTFYVLKIGCAQVLSKRGPMGIRTFSGIIYQCAVKAELKGYDIENNTRNR